MCGGGGGGGGGGWGGGGGGGLVVGFYFSLFGGQCLSRCDDEVCCISSHFCIYLTYL